MLRRWFKDSETILWARLQMFIGVALNALTFVPPELWQPVLPPRWFAVLVLANGIATEVLRRRRDKEM